MLATKPREGLFLYRNDENYSLDAIANTCDHCRAESVSKQNRSNTWAL